MNPVLVGTRKERHPPTVPAFQQPGLVAGCCAANYYYKREGHENRIKNSFLSSNYSQNQTEVQEFVYGAELHNSERFLTISVSLQSQQVQ